MKNHMDLTELDIENLAARLSENPRSPLFARLADLYLAGQRVNEAVALCEHGVGLYPSYAAGHIVLGKCYQRLGEIDTASTSYQHALDLSPYNTVVRRLLVALPEPAQASAGPIGDGAGTPQAVAGDDAANEIQADVQAATVLPTDEPSTDGATMPAEHQWVPVYDQTPPAESLGAGAPESFDPFPTFEQYIDMHPTTEPTMTLEEYLKGRGSSPMSEPSTDFESLAQKLQNAKRIVPAGVSGPHMPEADESGSAEQAIVSPTMAEIYVSQDKLDAAISAYQSLIIRQPAQSAVFAKRIAELQELLKNRHE